MTQQLRSPTLETIKMVEKVINDESAEFNKTQLWEKLPRKIMWPTFTTIVNYLEEINKIIISDNGVITWIWNPEFAQKMRSRKSLHFENTKTNKKIK